MKKYAPVWGLAFRPLFLLGAFWAIAVVLMMLILQAGISSPTFSFDFFTWHSHELIFGFAPAIIIGFIFTASQNWTGMRGLHGTRLQVLVLVWLLGRLVLLFQAPYWIAAIFDLSLFPLVCYFLIPYLSPHEQKRNQIFFVYFALLFFANLLIYLDVLNLFGGTSRRGVILGLNTIILMEAFISGRVIPFFTRAACPGAEIKAFPWLEKIGFLSIHAFLLADFVNEWALYTAIIALAVGIIHAIRFSGWIGSRIFKIPILLVMFMGYLWIIIAFLLKGLSYFTPINSGVPIHAFTVGGIGVLVYGFIGRVSLGHTGRMIKASRWMIIGYICINLAALIRVVGPLFGGMGYKHSIITSGLLWVIAFAFYLTEFCPILLRPRPDGKPG